MLDDLIVQAPDQEDAQQKEPQPNPELEELKSKLSELEQKAARVEQLEQELAQLRAPQQTAQPEQGVDLHSELARLKLAQALAADPVAQRYKEEVEAVLASVPPNVRATDFTIQSVIAYVKGKHVDELMEQVKKQPPTEVASSSAAPEPPKPEPPKLSLTDTQKVVLSAWFDGELSVAESLLGGER